MSSSSGLTLYGSQGSRSPLVNWGASEVGVSITMGNLQNNPHPFGQIPCLTDDDDVLVFESGAILQYVYSKAAETNGDSPARKAAITSWISWANASLDPICFLETPEGKVYVVLFLFLFLSFLCNRSLIYHQSFQYISFLHFLTYICKIQLRYWFKETKSSNRNSRSDFIETRIFTR